MDDPTILLEVSGGIGVVRFNRPAALNAIDRAMASALRAAVEALAQDAEVRVVVFRGDARAFSVGADLRERQSMTPEETWAHTQAILAAAEAIAALPMPTVAAIRGHCLAGGAELALACDVRLAAEGSSFGFPEVKRGIFPGAGAVVRLPRLIGPSRAADLILSGRTVDAEEALRLGLIDRLFPLDAFKREVAAYVDALRDNAPLALRAAKAAIWQGLDLPLAEAQALANRLRRPLDDTEDYREGLRAFAERREPRFTGR